MTSQLTEIALQMLGTIERMELIIPEITDTIRKALEEKAALTKPVPSADGEVAELVAWLRSLEGASVWFEEGTTEAMKLSRSAELLEHLAPQPVQEGPSDEDAIAYWYEVCEGEGDDGILSFARYVQRTNHH